MEHYQVFADQMKKNSDIAGLIPDYMRGDIPAFLIFAGGMWRFSYVFSVMQRHKELGLSMDEYVGLRNEMELWLEGIPGFYDVYRTHTSQLGAHNPAFLTYLAEEVYTKEYRTFADFEREFGPNDPRSLAARQALAVSYERAGRPDKAISQLERALADCKRTLGHDAPLTREILNKLDAIKCAEQTGLPAEH